MKAARPWRRGLEFVRGLRWTTWVVLGVVVLAEVLIAVPGDPASLGETASKPVDQRIKAHYQSHSLGSGERVEVDQFVHGWPLPCLTRGIGRVELRTRGAGLIAGAFPTRKSTFISGHPRTLPRWSISLPSDGDDYTMGPGATPSGGTLIPTDSEQAPVGWSDYNRWPLAIDAAEWRLGPLLLDLAVLALIALAAAAAAEWWIRRRGGLWRFQLSDLGLGVVALSLAFAWYGSHAKLRQAEKPVGEFAFPFLFPEVALRQGWERNELGDAQFDSFHAEYQGPDWLRRLVGNQDLVRFCKHVTAVELVADQSWDRKLKALAGLARVEAVSFPAGATPQAIEQLRALPRLRHLVLRVRWEGDEQPGPAGERWLTAEDLAVLESLPLVRLDLWGAHLLMEDLERVARAPTLRRLEVIDPWITAEELERLKASRPEVEIACVWAQTLTTFSSPRPYSRYSEEPPPGIEDKIEYARSQRRGASPGQ